ncbi:DNA internalization-related competence protein ComEC/Rec2 [Anaerosalibacter sp. Marseille-P3206]|uniref:DNA internalization-related competence protein ComEC/Rec2 n=1 Tax=Anaerosalibacter sp. Marseille-P3206 TaxID=1871005 RepID=UPI0013564B1A|nr:DNA internalization-related competence protein ComEC/Rec2 [Anaerosalibacter sp. Marseille-P3206]
MYRKIFLDKPFIQITIPMAIGIVFCYYIKFNINFILIGLAVLLSIYIFSLFRNKKTNYILYFLFFVLGIFLMYEKTEKSVIVPYIGREVQVEGVVLELKDTEEYSNIILKGEYIFIDGEKRTIKEKIMLKVYGDLKVDTGYKLVVSGALKQAKRNTNPELFNYKLYLETNDIFTTMNTNDYRVKVLSKGNLSSGEELRKKFKNSVEETFSKYLDVEKSELMMSIMLGDMTYLDENNQIKYRDLGLAHLMAISGLHIGIISAFLMSLFLAVGINRRISYVFTVFLIWFYGYLVGFPPSVLRSLIMCTLLFYSEIINRPYDNVNTLLFAAFILLIYNPLWLFNVGFQLSFSATFSLMIFSKILKDKFYPYRGKFYTSLFGILAVQIGICPVLAYYFNSISVVSILANLLLIPIMSIGVILGFILYLISFISNFLAVIVGSILNFLLSIESIVSNYIHLLPMGTIRVKSPNILEFTLYYFIIFCLFDIIEIKKYAYLIKRAYLYSLAILILAFSILPLYRNQVELRFIDVGQGDSILLQTGSKNFLIDTGGNLFGNFDIGKNILVPYLVKNGIFTLDGVFITHFHEDHVKSLPYLMDNIRVKNLFIGYEREENKLYCESVERARSYHIPIYKINDGDTLRIAKNVYIKVLNPSDEVISLYGDNENNLSLVLLLNSFNYKTLLTGDIENEIEKILVEKSEKIDFLKVPHHGSNTSSCEDFLDSFSPSNAFIMVGNNNFGHPNKDVLNRYEERGIKVFRTDKSGLITLKITPKAYYIDEYIKEKDIFKDIVIKYGLEINMLLLYTILWYIIISIDLQLNEELNKYDLSRFYNRY